MADLADDRSASGPVLTRRASCLLLAVAALTACGRKGDLYLPEGRTPAPTSEQGDGLPDRTHETDNLEER